MKQTFYFGAVLLILVGTVGAQPTVDGKIDDNEYGGKIAVIDGTATLAYQQDDRGGFFFAISAPTTGWVGVGLGSQRMDGATIFMGYVKDGKSVFSEQKGVGHSHNPSPVKLTDRNAVGQIGELTTVEFHIPFERLPFKGKIVDYITAYAGSADLSTFHEDNLDSGSLTLPELSLSDDFWKASLWLTSQTFGLDQDCSVATLFHSPAFRTIQLEDGSSISSKLVSSKIEGMTGEIKIDSFRQNLLVAKTTLYLKYHPEAQVVSVERFHVEDVVSGQNQDGNYEQAVLDDDAYDAFTNEVVSLYRNFFDKETIEKRKTL